MSSMHIFFDIPKVQQVDLLVNWLDLSEIVNLDSAACSRKWRAEFLDLLSSPELVLLNCFEFFEEHSETWVIQRKVSFEEVELRYRVLSNDVTREALLRVLGPKLQSLILDCKEDYRYMDDDDPALQIDQILIDVAEHCCNLRRIEIFSATLDGTLSVAIRANRLLKGVSIVGCTNILPGVLKTIVSLPCLTEFRLERSVVTDTVSVVEPNLTCQKLIIRDCKIKSSVVAWLCQFMPNVTEIHVDLLVGLELVCVALHCPHVKIAFCVLADALADTEVRAIAENWQSIEILVLLRKNDLRAGGTRYQPACRESAAMILIDQCHSLLQLKLASSEWTDQTRSSSYASVIDYDYQNAALSKMDNIQSRLTDLCVPSLSAQNLATIVQKCVYLNTLRILHPLPVPLDSNSAEFALQQLTNTKIKTLYLKNCSNLKPAHIRPLKKMTRLLLCNMPLLEEFCIIKLCRRSPDLRELYIKSCSGVHYTVVLEVLDLCPQMTHFEYNAKSPEAHAQESNPAATAAVSLLSTLVRRDYKNLKHFSVRC